MGSMQLKGAGCLCRCAGKRRACLRQNRWMLNPDFISAADVLASVAKRVEVDEGRLERLLELPPAPIRLLGREFDRYGPLGRGSFVRLFTDLERRSRAACELETVLRNASISQAIPWFEARSGARARHAPGADIEVNRMLRAVAEEANAAILAYRKGDLLPGSTQFPQLIPLDTSPLQWIGTDRKLLVGLLDEAELPHGLAAPAKVRSTIHRAKSDSPATFDELFELEYLSARARMTGKPMPGAMADAIWPSLLEACRKSDAEGRPAGVEQYQGGTQLRLLGKKLPNFDRDALRGRIKRRLNKESKAERLPSDEA